MYKGIKQTVFPGFRETFLIKEGNSGLHKNQYFIKYLNGMRKCGIIRVKKTQ